MKRLVGVLLVVVLLLAACGPRFSSMETEDLYNSIELLVGAKLTLADEENIEALEKRYKALDRDERAEITNYDVLKAAKDKLEEISATVDEINDKVKLYNSELPPEALDEIRLLWEVYQELAESDQKLVSGKSLENLKSIAEEWYGDDGYYAKMKLAYDNGDHEEVRSLGYYFMKANPPSQIKPFGAELIGKSILILAQQYKDSGDMEAMGKLFDATIYAAMPVEQKTQFVEIMVSAVTPKAKALADQKAYGEALSLLGTIPASFFNEAVAAEAVEVMSLCYSEQVTALYRAGNYEQALELCDKALAKKVNTACRNTLLAYWVDGSLELANRQMYQNNMLEAYELIDKAYRGGITDDQRAKIEAKKQTLLERTRPATGTVIEDTIGAGTGVFKVENSGKDILIKVVDRSDSTKYKIFFVRTGTTGTATFPDGSYSVEYLTGDEYITYDTFVNRRSFTKKYGETLDFETEYYYGGYQYTVYTWPVNYN